MGGKDGMIAWEKWRMSQRDSTMCTAVGDIMSSVARVAGYSGARCCGVKSRDDVRFRSFQSDSQ